MAMCFRSVSFAQCRRLSELAVEAAIFDEDLVGVHAGDDHASQVNTCALAFQRLRVRARPLVRGSSVIPMELRNFRSGL